jgi:hypothetical protein
MPFCFIAQGKKESNERKVMKLTARRTRTAGMSAVGANVGW